MLDAAPNVPTHPACDRHLVQFYDADPAVLVRNVAQRIDAELAAGGSVVIVATVEHSDAFLEAVTQRSAARRTPVRSGSLVCLDARATLERFLSGGIPDWHRFEQTVGSVLRTTRRGGRSGGLTVYGEMVGLLWQDGNYLGALTLERYWNVLLDELDFTLFCGYPIDIFGSDFRLPNVDELLCAHTTVLAGGIVPSMETALERAMDEVLGERVVSVRARMDAGSRAGPPLPSTEGRVRWLHENLPDCADQIVSRARLYYAALRTA